MTWTPNISQERREAIGRAGRAVVRLAADPEAKDLARRQNAIVNDPSGHTDREAWDAVGTLEHLAVSRGLVTTSQLEAEQRATAVAVLMAEEGPR